MKHIAKFYTENQIFYVDQKDNQLVCYCYETSGRKELSLGVVAGLMQSFFNSSKEKLYFIKTYQLMIGLNSFIIRIQELLILVISV